MNNHIIHIYQKWTKFYRDENLESFSHIFEKKETMIENTKKSIQSYDKQIADGSIFQVFGGLGFLTAIATIPIGFFFNWIEIASFKTVALCMSILFILCFSILLGAFISERKTNLKKQNQYVSKIKKFFDNDLYDRETFNFLLPQLQEYCNQNYILKEQFSQIKLNILNHNITDKDIKLIYRFMESYSKNNIDKIQLEHFVETTEKNDEQQNVNKNINFFTKS